MVSVIVLTLSPMVSVIVLTLSPMVSVIVLTLSPMVSVIVLTLSPMVSCIGYQIFKTWTPRFIVIIGIIFNLNITTMLHA
jgi:hypothetical protein